MKRVCSRCNREVDEIVVSSLCLCRKCYIQSYKQPERKCDVCNNLGKIQKIQNGKALCSKCYNRPKHICSICGNLDIIKKKNPNICQKCYKRPKKKCLKCGKMKPAKKKAGDSYVCGACYIRPIMVCSHCGFKKPTGKILDEQVLCRNCYQKWRLQNDSQFRIKEILKARLRKAFKQYSKFGKHFSSKKYGINYTKIIEHMGECPGKREDYQVDHIIPLCAFDFDDPVHVTAAFAPQNHQWLSKEDNLLKSDKYNKEDFIKYIKIFEE